MDVYVTSAFCKNNSGGNKAGIVFDSTDLTSEQKIQTAKELGFSETAFLSASQVADVKLQYFTPTEEVPLCGHATIAAFSTLRLLNMLNKQTYTIETGAGILHIRIKKDGLILMEQNCPIYSDILDANLMVDCVEDHFIKHKLPIQIISTGLKDIMLPICSVGHLQQLTPNFEKIAALCKERNVVGIHAFTLLEQSEITAICRNFAPLYGIDEESATGTASCALACYLFKYYQKQKQYIFEQGHNLGQISRIIVDITYHKDCIESVYVGGYGYLICQRNGSISEK